MEDLTDKNEDLADSSDGEEKEDFSNEDQAVRKAIFGFVAFILALSVIYVYGGFQQMLFFRPTPAVVEQPFVASVLNKETMELPLVVFAVRNPGNGTWRSEEKILNLVEQASRIWNQADIKLTLEEIKEIKASDEEMNAFLYNPPSFIGRTEGYNPENFNIFLTRRLGGLNGIAFPGMNAAAVADITTNNDFTVLAHEIGHLLGLDHVPGANRLMHQGSRGFFLIEEEIITARNRLKELQSR